MSEVTGLARKFISRGKVAALDHPQTAIAHIKGLCEIIEARPSTEQEVANKIAKRLPIWMLDTYDKDSLSSMLSAVSYLKQQVNNESRQDKVSVSRECAGDLHDYYLEEIQEQERYRGDYFQGSDSHKKWSARLADLREKARQVSEAVDGPLQGGEQ